MGHLQFRMDFEQLLSLQDVLDERLVFGELTWSQYESEWLALLRAADYTQRDYELGINRRWDYLHLVRPVACRLA